MAVERFWEVRKDAHGYSDSIKIDDVNGDVNIAMSCRSIAAPSAPIDFVAIGLMQYEAVEMALAILSRYDYNVAGILENISIPQEAIASLAGALNEYLDKAKE